MNSKWIVYPSAGLLVAACCIGIYFLSVKSGEILNKPLYEAAVKKQSLLDSGYYHVSSIDNYPRQTDVNHICGPVKYVVTDRWYETISEPSIGREFNVFCQNQPPSE